MAPLSRFALSLLPLVAAVNAATDPCATIGGKKWASPKDVRACLSSFKLDPAIKNNVLDVVSKTLAFHASVNYQIWAPEPYSLSVHEDLFKDIARINKTSYSSEYDFHIDLSRTFKRLNDGHCVWINYCFVTAFVNYLPIPLTLLTDKFGLQSVHIVPEAFDVAKAEFADGLDAWQDALPGDLKGRLDLLSGAKVLLINGLPPFAAVDANAAIAGSYQALGTRQIGFFSSYARAASSFSYSMGQFAQQSLPLDDSVSLLIQRVNQTKLEVITLPYRSRIGSSTKAFTDSASYRANNCRAVSGTNGVDIHDTTVAPSTADKFKQIPAPVAPAGKKHLMNVVLDTAPFTDITLPGGLQPTAPALNGSFGIGTFYLQKDGKTGVLALGSFSGANYDTMQSSLLQGLQSLKALGATQLIIDVTNNGGGYICVAHWLHRIIIGPKSTTVPEAGLDTKARSGPLAQQVVQKLIDEKLDPNQELLYNPLNWNNAQNVQFKADENWLVPPVKKIINGHPDAFSQRLGQECQPDGFTTTPPDVGFFEPSKIVIVSNGRCASSCSLFSITMAKEEGVRTVVVGGSNLVRQEYCGIVGGQSTDFATIDTEIKSTGLKSSPLAPPDLIVNGVQGITWRLGFGITRREEPEEWQEHYAAIQLPLTMELVNNPVKIWDAVTARVFK
ncbi:Peptidase S41 family protein ustP [Mycena indigotica]|uniref:Peptidase S41 family protein ustP n=1 Tax=Mycena indigotica TaxID=2126181 RepID=A0A8H6TIF8_9AGAR|nr:Peptidase S41 family protein ustP [Mycena indigotica]KAF7316315.1 Peptidase S41 family protein ustP [Mycena indigotica]